MGWFPYNGPQMFCPALGHWKRQNIMDRINDDSLDERINAEWTGPYRGFFAKASRYVPSISKNRKEDGENALHTTVERRLEAMWLQHYSPEITRLFFEEQRDLTDIRQHLAQSYGFRVSEERLWHFLRPSPPREPSQPVRKDFSDRTPDERATYVRSGIRNNSLQWLRSYWHISAEILPEKDTDATAHDPAEEVEERERFMARLIKMAREAMTEKQRSVFELWLEEMPHEEIAEALGISVEASRKRLHDGLARAARAARKQGMILVTRALSRRCFLLIETWFGVWLRRRKHSAGKDMVGEYEARLGILKIGAMRRSLTRLRLLYRSPAGEPWPDEVKERLDILEGAVIEGRPV